MQNYNADGGTCENRTSVEHVTRRLINLTLLSAPPTVISAQEMVQCSETCNTETSFYSEYSGISTRDLDFGQRHNLRRKSSTTGNFQLTVDPVNST
jgi:spore coat protein U-like protein